MMSRMSCKPPTLTQTPYKARNPLTPLTLHILHITHITLLIDLITRITLLIDLITLQSTHTGSTHQSQRTPSTHVPGLTLREHYLHLSAFPTTVLPLPFVT